jgi:hypothetical protein
MKCSFVETVNVKRCEQVLNLPKSELKDYFWDRQEFEPGVVKKMDCPTHVLILKRYLRDAISSKSGRISREYKFANGQTDGRLCVKNGGIQTLQKNVRNFLCGEFYYDVDMANCHHRLLLFLCVEHDIKTPHLRECVDDREKVLAEHNLTKKDLLIALYTDNIRQKRGNKWFNCFAFELSRTKKDLLEMDVPDTIKTDNTTNPDSSRLAHYLNRIENGILQRAIECFGAHSEVPMFDGLMVNRDFCPSDQLETHVEALNGIFTQEYHGCVHFHDKPTESTIELPEVEDGPQEYSVAKEQFEQDHFQTSHPHVFWKQSRKSDGSYAYNQLKENEFRLACKEHLIIDFKPNGDLKTTDIFDQWIKDKSRRKHQSIDFIPHGEENICPGYIFNTFAGFHANTLTEWEQVDTSNFNTLLWHLCGERSDVADYMTNFIAHMIQHPNRRPEKVIVFKPWTGCGKDTLYRTLRLLLGIKCVGITENPDHLFGSFNEILDSKICLFLNEMEGKHGVGYQEKIKGQCTATENRVNGKF